MGEDKRALDPFPIFPEGVPGEVGELEANIAKVADDLIAALDLAEKNAALCRDGLTSEAVKFITYTLFVSAVRRGHGLTEHHLRLLQKALAIKHGSPGAAKYLSVLPPVDAPHGFLAAADLEAADPNVSVSALARVAGVSRRTIGRWQKEPAYQERIRTTKYQNGHRTEEEAAVEAGWDSIIERLRRGGVGATS